MGGGGLESDGQTEAGGQWREPNRKGLEGVVAEEAKGGRPSGGPLVSQR